MFEWLQSLALDPQAGEARGEALVPADHPLLRDHFPGAPTLPGTLLLELAAQVAGPLAEEVTRRRHGLERWALLGMVRHAVFTRPAALPARLLLRARVERAEPSSVLVQAVAAGGDDGGERLRATLVMMMVEAAAGWEQAIRARHARLLRLEREA